MVFPFQKSNALCNCVGLGVPAWVSPVTTSAHPRTLSKKHLGIPASVLQRATHRMCVFVHKEIYGKGVAHTTLEAGESQELWGESARWGPRRAAGVCFSLKDRSFRSQEEPAFPFESKDTGGKCFHLKAVMQEDSPLPWEGAKPLFLFRPSTAWMRPTHIREGSLLYSVHLFKYSSHPEHSE